LIKIEKLLFFIQLGEHVRELPQLQVLYTISRLCTAVVLVRRTHGLTVFHPVLDGKILWDFQGKY
jgi:hypothetical protein